MIDFPSFRKRIEILGPGGARSKETYEVVKTVVEEAGLSVDLVKVDSIHRLESLGVLSTPSIAINGQLVFSGRIPNIDEVRHLLGVA